MDIRLVGDSVRGEIAAWPFGRLPKGPSPATTAPCAPTGAVGRGVVLQPGDPERRSLARSCASAVVRPAHGLHPLRHHRCRRPAELAGATGAAERGWHRAMALSRDQRRALRVAGRVATRCHQGDHAGAWLHDPGGDHRCRTAGPCRMMVVGPASCARTPSMRIPRQWGGRASPAGSRVHQRGHRAGVTDAPRTCTGPRRVIGKRRCGGRFLDRRSSAR
jgi:hypothetical protein